MWKYTAKGHFRIAWSDGQRPMISVVQALSLVVMLASRVHELLMANFG